MLYNAVMNAALQKDIVYALHHGEIIKQYADDKPYPSCLVLGRCQNEKWLHTLSSARMAKVFFITAYYPNPEEWEDDLKREGRNKYEVFYLWRNHGTRADNFFTIKNCILIVKNVPCSKCCQCGGNTSMVTPLTAWRINANRGKSGKRTADYRIQQ